MINDLIGVLELNYQPLPLPHRQTLSDEQSVEESRAYLQKMHTRHSVRHFSDVPVPQEVIFNAIAAAGTAPSGANQQPWHFCAINDPAMKAQIREHAEARERRLYEQEEDVDLVRAAKAIGVSFDKPHLTEAQWLIIIFAQLWGVHPNGRRFKHYYVLESVGISTGLLITGLHYSGLASLTHTSGDMAFLNPLCGRPNSEKPVTVLAVGHPAEHATVASHSKVKKHLSEIMSVYTDIAGEPMRSTG